jgi:uncharacterized protein involved in exopolysaccharide biosynthesis
MIRVTPVRDTELITITVEGTDPVMLARIANTVVQVMVDRINSYNATNDPNANQILVYRLTQTQKVMQDTADQRAKTNDPAEIASLDAQTARYQQVITDLLTSYIQSHTTQITPKIVQVNQAQLPTVPVGPNVLQNTVIAAFLAALLTIGYIIALNLYDETRETSATKGYRWLVS